MIYVNFFDWWNKTGDARAGKGVKTIAEEAWDAGQSSVLNELKERFEGVHSEYFLEIIEDWINDRT